MKLRYILASGLAFLSASLFAQTHTQGIEYYKADQFSNAKELLNRNLNNSGTDKSLSYYYLGQLAMRDGNKAEAGKYFNDGIAADAENPYNYVGLGYIALKDGDEKGAEKYFKEAEKRAKKDQSVNVEIARAYYNANPVTYKAKYEKIIENALKKDSKNPDIYIFQGDVFRDDSYASGDTKTYGQAAAKYDMATSFDPQSAVAYVKYADLYMNAQNPGYAIIKLEELINNNPSSALGQRELANAYYENSQFDKAAEKYGQYVKNPNHFKEDENRYAFILFYDGKYQEGYDYASTLLKEDPNDFTAMRFQFMNAAQIPSMSGNLLNMAEKLVEFNKSNPEKYPFAIIDINLISAELAKDKKIDDAILIINNGIKNYPSNINFWEQLASIYVEAEEYDKASDAYFKFVEKNPKPGYYEFSKQALYSFFGGLQNYNDVVDQESGNIIRPKNIEEASKYFNISANFANKAIEADETKYKPYKILGDIALAQATESNRTSIAQPMYERAVLILEENPDDRAAADAKSMYSYLGNYYLENKDVAKAKEFFNKYLTLDPTNEKYRQFVESLK